jgi:alanyl aminopeptidase
VTPPPVAVPTPAKVDPYALAPDGSPTLRLPRVFLPTKYAARLAIDPAKTSFTGTIAITANVSQPTSRFWLHGARLTIAKATISHAGAEQPVTVTQLQNEMLRVDTSAPLEVGEYTLTIEYSGVYDLVSSAGAFRQTQGGDAYVYSQFEATYARRVFPCFDEPDNKVPWQLTLDVPTKMVAVSNTAIASETPIDAKTKRVEFSPTKPLPTYLIAFGVGPFAIVDGGKTAHGTPIRVLTFRTAAAEATYAASTAARVVDRTEEWFGTPYPYPKLDFLTIPITIGFGAMENAGLITFTETLIMMPKDASERKRHTWISVSAHEIAHQWFGDLVTTAYWDDIWLNEGFANWMETKTSSAFEPAWHDRDSELSMRNYALDDDSLVSARQIRQPIASNDDILNIFDGITYDKGASVLGMFETFVGPEVFQRGVREYLAAHEYGNATSTDFASAIAKAAGNPVLADAFATFLEQPGAPEVTATLSCDGGPHVALSQRRYLGPGAPAPSATKPWILPICVAYDAGGKRAQACTLLDQATTTLPLKTKTCPRWVMPNAEARGYYRVEYTAQQLTALRDEAWSYLGWSERRAVVFDADTLAHAGKVPLQLTLSFVPKLIAGGDRFTVPAAIGVPEYFDVTVPENLRPKYEYWLQKTFGAAAEEAGIEAGDASDPKAFDTEEARSSLLHAAGWTGRDPVLVEAAVKAAANWRALPQAVRGLVLQIAVDAQPALFDRILAEAPKEADRTKRGEMYKAVASVRDVPRQSKALALLLDKKVDFREVMWLPNLWKNDATRLNSQAFIRAHEKEILQRMPADGSTFSLGELAYFFTSGCDPKTHDANAKYVTEHYGHFPGAERVVAQAIEGETQCIAKRSLLAPQVDAWLGGVRIIADPGDKPPTAEKRDKRPQRPKAKSGHR